MHGSGVQGYSLEEISLTEIISHAFVVFLKQNQKQILNFKGLVVQITPPLPLL